MNKRKRNMPQPNVLTGVMLLGAVLAAGNGVDASSDSKFLRRKDAERSRQSNELSPDRMLRTQVVSEMEDLWEKVAELARVQIDEQRLLNGSPDFSMPSTPSTPSVPSTSPPIQKPTSPPHSNCLQGRTREEFIFDSLIDVTAESLLTDPSTPQGRAFDYLMNDDPYLSDPCVSTTLQQRYGLTTMYYSLGGEAWQNSTGWLGDDQECLWFGVDCIGGNSSLVTGVTLCKCAGEDLFKSLLMTSLTIFRLLRFNQRATIWSAVFPTKSRHWRAWNALTSSTTQ